MHPATQVLHRNIDEFSSKPNLLVFGSPNGDSLDFLEPKKVVTFDYRVYRSLEPALKERVSFGDAQNAPEQCDAAIVYVPKSKGELDLVLAFVCSMLCKGAQLYLVGEKKGGIASAAKKLISLGANASKIDSAKHCQLWHVTLDDEPKAFDLSSWYQSYQVTIGETHMELATIPGVFSFSRLDEGTQLLLETFNKPKAMPSRLRGRVIDFGCGSGVIGIYAALKNEEVQLEMVDINWLALQCAKRSCELNQVEARVYASDGWSDVEGRVNGILTNPPFHSGISTEYQTTEVFIKTAKDKMSKHAPLYLVANGFLRYPPIIESSLESFRVLAENTRFRVYFAKR